MEVCIYVMPTKISPNPAIEYPILESRLLAKRLSIAPTKTRGKKILLRLNLNPNKAIIQPFNVVPMLAPKIIPSASGNVMRSAPTKPTAATVVRLED